MNFEDYFSDEKLILYLCELRARKAKQRSEKHLIHLISKKSLLNHHDKISAEEKLIRSVLPPRRKWKKLSKKNRYKNKWQKINSVDYNTKSIYFSVQYHLKNHPKAPFILNLKKFISSVRAKINSPVIKFENPQIYPVHKKPQKRSKECRPISVFPLEDKIIISKTNAYLTKVFDNIFDDRSYAFRSSRIIDGNVTQVDHHNAIKEILIYKNKYRGKRLYVSECDMSKFYDSVNHSIIKKQFRLKEVQLQSQNLKIDKRAKDIFYAYLKSYSFNRNVLPLNNDEKFWESHNYPNDCNFEWVKQELLDFEHYKKFTNCRIGIPQGGAISGFIANLVLDHADNKIKSLNDKKLFYVRFCDDMILIHPYKYKCENAIDIYKKALIELKLIPHSFEKMTKNNKDLFWDKKSKKPYKWSDNITKVKTFPWIGFVGYEIHYTGIIRVRKSTLKKEIQKQKKIIKKIIKNLDNTTIRKRRGTIKESAIHRLVGMSVGRVAMWNHRNLENEMCWVNGFPELKNNSVLRKQLKHLDHFRNYQIYYLQKYLYSLEQPVLYVKERKRNYYGKPYSYYWQALNEIKENN